MRFELGHGGLVYQLRGGPVCASWRARDPTAYGGSLPTMDQVVSPATPWVGQLVALYPLSQQPVRGIGDRGAVDAPPLPAHTFDGPLCPDREALLAGRCASTSGGEHWVIRPGA